MGAKCRLLPLWLSRVKDIHVLSNGVKEFSMIDCSQQTAFMPCWQLSGFDDLNGRLSVEAFPQDIYILPSHSQIKDV